MILFFNRLLTLPHSKGVGQFTFSLQTGSFVCVQLYLKEENQGNLTLIA